MSLYLFNIPGWSHLTPVCCFRFRLSPELAWPGLAWRGVAVQVCNMDGGASHSAEHWMALFMLLFAAEKVDTPLPSHWFLNFRLITGTGVSSCWIRQQSCGHCCFFFFWLAHCFGRVVESGTAACYRLFGSVPRLVCWSFLQDLCNEGYLLNLNHCLCPVVIPNLCNF